MENTKPNNDCGCNTDQTYSNSNMSSSSEFMIKTEDTQDKWLTKMLRIDDPDLEQPFMCGLCGKGFNQKHQLK